MSNRNLKHSLRSTLASLALASSLTGVVAACSADAPTVTQVPSTISAQVPETAAPVAEGLSFYYDGVKTSVSSKDAAVLFAACTLNTGDAAKIVDFVNKTLKAGPITPGDVTGLGDPLQPAISDFNGNGVVNCEDAAILFAVSTVGVDAVKVNNFVSGTLKISGVTVTQAQLDSFFKTPATPTPTPPPTPTPTPTPVFFFVDPVYGSNTNPGTATEPFLTVEYALTTAIVSSAANTTGSGTDGGTDVTVKIVGTGPQSVLGNISTPNLTKGSVTVVGPSGFNLNLNGNLLTLNKGYRLKGFKIISGDPGGSGTKAAAITLASVGTSLENMKIDCQGLDDAGTPFTALGDRCIEVTAEGGTITLKGLEVKIPGTKSYIAAIVHAGNNTTLEVVDSTIESIGSGSGTNGRGVVGVLGGASAGPVIVRSSTVDLTSILSGTNAGPSIAVWLNVGGSKVLGPSSKIKLNGGGGNSPPTDVGGAIGIKASHSSGTVTVEGTTFSTGTDGVGIGIKNAATGTGSLSLGTNNNTFPTSPSPQLNVNVSL